MAPPDGQNVRNDVLLAAFAHVQTRLKAYYKALGFPDKHRTTFNLMGAKLSDFEIDQIPEGAESRVKEVLHNAGLTYSGSGTIQLSPDITEEQLEAFVLAIDTEILCRQYPTLQKPKVKELLTTFKQIEPTLELYYKALGIIDGSSPRSVWTDSERPPLLISGLPRKALTAVNALLKKADLDVDESNLYHINLNPETTTNAQLEGFLTIIKEATSQLKITQESQALASAAAPAKPASATKDELLAIFAAADAKLKVYYEALGIEGYCPTFHGSHTGSADFEISRIPQSITHNFLQDVENLVQKAGINFQSSSNTIQLQADPTKEQLVAFRDGLATETARLQTPKTTVEAAAASLDGPKTPAEFAQAFDAAVEGKTFAEKLEFLRQMVEGTTTFTPIEQKLLTTKIGGTQAQGVEGR